MFRKYLKSCVIFINLILISGNNNVAKADDFPPPYRDLDGNGVNLISGSMTFRLPEVKLGYGEQSIYANDMISVSAISGAVNNQPVFNFFDDFNGVLSLIQSNYGLISVYMGDTGNLFSLINGIYYGERKDGSYLKSYDSNSRFIFGDKNGTEITYNRYIDKGGVGFDTCFPNWNWQYFNCSYIPTEIRRSTGEIFKINYELITSSNQDSVPNMVLRRRVSSIHSNFGYDIFYSYVSNSTDTQNQASWARKSVKSLCNTSFLDSCKNITYGYIDPVNESSKGNYTITHPDGRKWSFFTGKFSDNRLDVESNFLTYYPIEKIVTPSKTIDISFKNNTVDPYGYYDDDFYGYISSVLSGEDAYNYQWSKYNGRQLLEVKKNSTYYGKYLSLISGSYRRPLEIEDPLGNKQFFSYDSNGRMINYKLPLGNEYMYYYDERSNITKSLRREIGGSGYGDVSYLSGYVSEISGAYECSPKPYCNKPSWKRDPLGNQTDYTYDPVHGGLISELEPAPSIGGARPLRLIFYAQRYAWVKNASGTFVQSDTPIWVKSSEVRCQTSSGANPETKCDTNAPIATTTYEYGAAGTWEALLVKGVTLTSAGTTLHTCYTYDIYGQKLSETAPRSTLNACS